MSIRTLVEINHDLLSKIDYKPDSFVDSLMDVLADPSSESKKFDLSIYGVEVKHRRQHYQDVKIVEVNK